MVALVMTGCHGGSSNDAPAAVTDTGIADTGRPDASASALCPACLSSSDCGDGVCAQFAADSFCAPKCGASGECASDRSCATLTSFSGEQISVCVPRGDVCGPTEPVPPPSDAGLAPCGTYVPPGLTSTCKCASTKCDPNGCYGGWWCDTATNRCHSPPPGCPGAGDGGASETGGYDGGGFGPGPPVPYVGGDAPTGTVDVSGGTISRLYFSVIGDTRPATNDDTAGYPTSTITKIYRQVAAVSPPPSFALSTGDYMFASPGSGQSAPQLDLYLGARKGFSGPLFPALGNHECTGMTASNCGVDNKDGETQNYKDFLAKMLAPIAQTKPWYSISLAAPDASWTAKLVFIAGNAWGTEQATWLEAAMSVTTTYTFVVRHEPSAATTAPGVTPSDAILGKHPYTLLIVGHTHTYGHRGRQIIVGNGGAPLTGSANYGFAMISQEKDGAIAVDMLDYATGLADSAFHFRVAADGSPLP